MSGSVEFDAATMSWQREIAARSSTTLTWTCGSAHGFPIERWLAALREVR